MNRQDAPTHRERLLDLSTQTVVPNPNPHRLELPAADSAKPLPEEDIEAPALERETADANRIAQQAANTD